MATKTDDKTPKKTTPAKEVPKGFREISAHADSHDWDEEPILIGVIRRIDVARVPSIQNPAVQEDRRVMHVETEDEHGVLTGEREAVWESGGLRALFECKVGDRVYIEFTGFGEQKDKKKNPPRLYRVGVSEQPAM